MFGYITPNMKALSDSQQKRFRAFYCGLCRELRQRSGLLASITLSYDMTFLALLLNALYEPGETARSERCALHPLRQHDYIETPAMAYVADMNIALAYHKCRDNWQDDRNIASAAEGAMLKTAYARVRGAFSRQCECIEQWLDQVHRIENAEAVPSVDALANATGAMLGELFDWRGQNDIWSAQLRQLGDGLGRFIYFMDAYEDLPSDVRRHRFNPLRALSGSRGYDALCKDAMLVMVADATEAFEQLPIVQDADILRNVLYSGIWSRLSYIRKKRRIDE